LLRAAETKQLVHIADIREYVASNPADKDLAAFAKLSGVRTVLAGTLYFLNDQPTSISSSPFVNSADKSGSIWKGLELDARAASIEAENHVAHARLPAWTRWSAR
jgi:hypothetical protein